MVLPSTGPLSFSQIRNEFGQNSTDSLGGYRIKQTVGQMVDMPLSEGIGQEDDDQTSNSIRFSQFLGNRLNVVLQYNTNYGTFSDQDPAPGAQEKYQDVEFAGTGVNDEVVVVGNFKDKPANGGGKRIIIHVTSTIGGGKKNIEQTKCSLITGNGWANDTEFYINVGPTGLISGTGGFGGQRGSEGSNGGAGEDGSSAIGINYVSTTNLTNKIIVQEGGAVRAGGGGGGGGGGAESDTSGAPGGDGGAGAGIPDHESGPDNSNRKKGVNGATGDKEGDAAGGGGGGGGAMPGGTPGEGGEAPTKTGDNLDNSQADDGLDGTTEGGGAGGEGDAEGGDQFEGDGGAGGQNGFAIARVVNTNIPTIIDPGDGIKGDISEPIFGSLQKAELL